MAKRLLPASLLLFATVGLPLYAMTACTKESPSATVVSAASSAPVSASATVDPGPTAEQCRALYDRAQADSLAAWNRASKACKSDGDCVSAGKRACLGDCGLFPIAKGSLAEWTKARGEIEATTCKTFLDGECTKKVPMAMPTCAAPRIKCRNGECVDTN